MNDETDIRILVVEDDEGLLTLLLRSLKKSGYLAEGSASGGQFLEKFDRDRFDLCLIDYMLPDMSANELIEKLRVRDREVPFVIITGYADVKKAVEMMRLGALDYIVKEGDFLDNFPVFIKQVVDRVTLKKQLWEAQDSILRINRTLNSIIRAVPLGLVVMDSRGCINLWSPAAASILGWERGETVGRLSSEIWGKRSAIVRVLSGLVATREEIRDREIRETKKDGSAVDISLYAAPIIDADGGVSGVLGVFEDISRRKREEEELARKEERYRLLAENAVDVIWTTDFDLHFTFVSKSVETLLGYRPDELIGSGVEKHLTPESRRIVFEMHSRTFSRWKRGDLELPIPSLVFELEQVRRDGSTVWTEVKVNFQLDAKNRPQGIVGVSRDISRRKQAESEKEKIRNQLFQAQKLEAVGILAGGVAHDFNNLLTAIQGNVDLAEMKSGSENTVVAPHLKQIRNSVVMASSMTRKLLLFSRRQPSRPRLVNVNKVVQGMLKILTRLIGEDVEIRTRIEESIASIRADPANIEQMLMNLCLNSRDAMPEGGLLEVTTENVPRDAIPFVDDALEASDYVHIAIRDTGGGMEKEEIEHIFEPFYTTKDMGRGSGLGLAVVYGIVQQNKASIHVESVPGEGTTFHVYFPALNLSDDEVEPDPVTLERFRGQGETLLLVEDAKTVRLYLEEVLTRYGYRVLSAADAAGALEVFRDFRDEIRLVFSDVVLPDQTGIRLVETILSEKPRIPVVYTSGYLGDRSHGEEIEKKNIPFLQKPFTLYQVLKIIHRQFHPIDS